MKAIETRYAGYRFRSRLEARWAVFFDHMGIEWTYETEGYALSVGNYLPDFLLTDCGTWVEVKGDPNRLDKGLLLVAAAELPERRPRPGCESGPQVLVLGDIPRPQPAEGDYGWVGISTSGAGEVATGRYGFGMYLKNRRPWWLDVADIAEPWLEPTWDPYESGAMAAYEAARSSRFEHGQVGAP